MSKRGRRRASASLPASVDAAALRKALFATKVPSSELWRTYFGRNTTMARIEAALRNAEVGSMLELTDLATETVGVDPHLASVLRKRLGAIKACDWDVTPAQGEGLDKREAADVAEVVRRQLRGLPTFKQAIEDLAWGLFHGRSALEIHWQLEAGSVPWRVDDLGWIHPRRLSFGPARELRVADGLYSSLYAAAGVALRDVPLKFIEFTPRLFCEYPEREGLAPRCLYWSFFKRFSARERMILIELFGKPWRIVEVDNDSRAGAAELDQALDMADALGSATAAQFPRGTKLAVVTPDPKSGELHNSTIADCDRQMSKLVLGNTGTTDAEANRAESVVHKSEQDVILQSDGAAISERIQRSLVDAIVLLNYGAEKLRYSPLFQLRTSPVSDRAAELDRMSKMVLQLGVPVALAEVYEVTGFRPPAPDEATVELEPPAFGAVATPHGRIVPPREVAEDVDEAESDDHLVAFNATNAGRSHGLSAHGSPETIVSRGTLEGARETTRWTTRFVEAAAAATDAPRIYRALAMAARHVDVGALARAVERRALHAAMLGAIDSVWEREHDATVAPAKFAAGEGQDNFAAKPFHAAIQDFRAREILRKSDFEQLSGAAKRRAFTVAGLARDDMLKTAHDELGRALAAGADLATFGGALATRFEEAGWTQLNSSHVELVFRNAAMGGYASGRDAEMKQPAVLAARPFWQVLGVDDDRTRPSHRAALGKVLRADDAFWAKAPLPWGHNCRCRKVSRSQKDVERLGLSITTGAELGGLPDKGWDSRQSLLS
jgi:phage gp29-like protein